MISVHTLYVDWLPETAIDKAKYIKNPKWWGRVFLFIRCISPAHPCCRFETMLLPTCLFRPPHLASHRRSVSRFPGLIAGVSRHTNM
ncbi:hypothetical protein BDR03DRAFT_281474 [Suillus americanus]|nr:hypothetical protein BDR03DRAFT_281474 [Suillus americanus]